MNASNGAGSAMADSASAQPLPWLRKEVIGAATLYLGDARTIVPAIMGGGHGR